MSLLLSIQGVPGLREEKGETGRSGLKVKVKLRGSPLPSLLFDEAGV